MRAGSPRAHQGQQTVPSEPYTRRMCILKAWFLLLGSSEEGRPPEAAGNRDQPPQIFQGSRARAQRRGEEADSGSRTPGDATAEALRSSWQALRHTRAVPTATSPSSGSRRGCKAGHASAFGTLCLLVFTQGVELIECRRASSVAENKPSQAPSSALPACVCQISPGFAGTHGGISTAATLPTDTVSEPDVCRRMGTSRRPEVHRNEPIHAREHRPTETHTVKHTRTHGCSRTLGEASAARHLRSDEPGTCAPPDPWLMVTHPHSWGHARTWLPNQKASVCSWIYLLPEA